MNWKFWIWIRIVVTYTALYWNTEARLKFVWSLYEMSGNSENTA